MTMNCLIKMWAIPGGQRRRGQPKSRWIDGVEEDSKGYWVVETGGGISGIEVAGDNCWRIPRPTQGCRADDDDDDDDGDDDNENNVYMTFCLHLQDRRVDVINFR
jgi:hypothetical protein